MHFAKIINSSSKFNFESIQDTRNLSVQYNHIRHFQFQIENNNEAKKIGIRNIYDCQTIKIAKNCHVVCNTKIPGTDVFTINQ